MVMPSPYTEAGNALEPVVYNMIESEFGHRVKFKNRKLLWTRPGMDFPILSRYIDGMVRWLGEPQLLEIKTTSDRNFNFVVQSVREGKPCNSLQEYTHQMQVYAAMLWSSKMRGTGFDPLPPDLIVSKGVLALLNRDKMQLKMMQIDLFPSGPPADDFLEPEMRELEFKLGVTPEQMEAKEAEASALDIAREAVREVRGRFRKRFGRKFEKGRWR